MLKKLPLGWKEVLLPEVIFFQEGPGIRKWQFKNEGIKLLNVRNLVDGSLDLTNTERFIAVDEVDKTYKHFLADAGDLVLASSGVTWGKTAWVEEEHLPLCMNTSTIRLRPLSERILNKSYMRYFIDSKLFTRQMERMVTGAAQPNFGPVHLKQVVVPLPPLEIQHKIVSILDEADNLRMLRKQANNKMKELIPALFDEMFGDPFTNPKGWEVKRIGDICDPQYGYTASACESGKFRYVRITDISEYGRLNENAKYIEDFNESSNYLLSRGDLLVARTGATFGKTLLYNGIEPSVFASYLIRLKFNDLIMPEYYWAFAFTEYYWKQARMLSTGAGQPQFNANAIVQIKLPVPPLSLQRQVTELVSNVENEVKNQSHCHGVVNDLFNSLMDRCMSGEIC